MNKILKKEVILVQALLCSEAKEWVGVGEGGGIF